MAKLPWRIGWGLPDRGTIHVSHVDRADALSFLLGLLISLGASLLFSVQPIVTGILLPAFGGSASVWIVSLLFFQGALVVGYALSHGLARLFPERRAQVSVLAALAALASVQGLFGPVGALPASESPAAAVLGQLARLVGPQVLLVAAVSPLCQNWMRPESARPFRLYALSNLAALVSLCLYPVLVEPFVDLSDQLQLWRFGFAGLAVLLIVCAVVGVRASTPATALARSSGPELVIWLSLPALGTVTLAAVSDLMATRIAPVPLLWVGPLVLYLLSWVLTFDSNFWYRRAVWAVVLVISAIGVGYVVFATGVSFWLKVAAPLGVLLSSCMICHGELAARRPDPARLTTFYLCLAIGGLLGTAAASLVAPMIFDQHLESQLAIVAVLTVLALTQRGTGRGVGAGLAVIAAVSFTLLESRSSDELIEQARTFYNDHEVHERGDPPTTYLISNGILHGAQRHDLRRFPTTYFSRQSGVGIALDVVTERQRAQVAVIGLGAGTIAAYSDRFDDFVFYEIDPVVERLAREHFTFLDDSAARVRVELGDARLSLEAHAAAGGQQFQLIVVDAFSGDALAPHLVTRDAWALYWQLLSRYGILAINITNLYFDFLPVMRANNIEDRPMYVVRNPASLQSGIYPSRWVLVSDNRALARHPMLERLGEKVDPDGRELLWTDERHSVVPLIRWSLIDR